MIKFNLGRAVWNRIRANGWPSYTYITEAGSTAPETVTRDPVAKAAFTPGPWSWFCRFEDGLATGAVHAQGPNTSTAIAICPKYESENQWDANARLIAAAPQMLEALQELEDFLHSQADVDDGIPNDAMRHLVETRAAIARATGGQP